MRIKRYGYILVLVSLFFSRQGLANVIVDLRSEAKVSDTYVHLKDIADFLSGDKVLIEEMKELIVSKAPVPGVAVFIRDIEVKAALQRNSLLKNAIVQGSDKIRVETLSTIISGEDIRLAAKEFVLNNMPELYTDVEVDIFNKPADIVLEKGEVLLNVIPATKNYLSGNVVVIVQVLFNGEIKKKIPINLRVKRFDQVVVCNRAIVREEMICASDLSLARREITQMAETPLNDIEDAVGKVVLRRVKEQTVLTCDMLQEPILVKRRSLVTIILPFKGLHISSKGIAKKDGRKGEYIAVENLDTKKEIYGEVISEGTIRVNM